MRLERNITLLVVIALGIISCSQQETRDSADALVVQEIKKDLEPSNTLEIKEPEPEIIVDPKLIALMEYLEKKLPQITNPTTLMLIRNLYEPYGNMPIWPIEKETMQKGSIAAGLIDAIREFGKAWIKPKTLPA